MNYALTPKLELSFRAPDVPRAGPIKFTVGRCVEGGVLVARSQLGICAIFLDDDVEGLRRQLREAFPSDRIEEASRELGSDLATVVAFIDKSAAAGVIRLDVGGTTFQQRVWEALSSLPAGETRTYAQIAECIGAPQAVRAVASACAANLLAIAIPCHRVVRGDGSNSGYRWGAARKRVLLEREHA
jgi:O-6-methylguanine DNA methyltransferase